MKKKLITFLFFFAVFIAAVIGISLRYAHKNQADAEYTELGESTLPVISLGYGEGMTQSVHGYLDEMEFTSMREEILPLNEKRELTVQITSSEKTIDSVHYQIRSLDGSHLIEDGLIAELAGKAAAPVTLKFANLLTDGQEYMLMFTLASGDETIHYYNRIIYTKEDASPKMIRFVKDFSASTYTKNSAFVVDYLQPAEDSQTDDFGHIDIHSKYKMFTWQNLTPMISTDVTYRITDLSTSQMTMILDYSILLETGDTNPYHVTETYVVRYRNEKVYLLDYERDVTENFDASALVIENGNIHLGITAKTCQSILSEDENRYVFEYCDQIFSYNAKEKEVFPIYDYNGKKENNKDTLPAHSIDLIQVDNDGNMDFCVYGYQSRGFHEGRNGIAFYRYSSEENVIKELFFIPSTVSPEILEKDLGAFAHVTQNDMLYLLFGNTIYSIDLESGEKMMIASQSRASGFFKNENETVVAWQNGEEEFSAEISVMNLDTGKIMKIEAGEGDYVVLKGILGNDVIYTTGKKDAIVRQAGVVLMTPFYRLQIVDAENDLNEELNYQPEDIVLTNATIETSTIRINRKRVSGTEYQELDDDLIYLNTKLETAKEGTIKSKSGEDRLKEFYIAMGINSELMTYSKLVPKYQNDDGNKSITLERAASAAGTYFVYGKGHLNAIEETLDRAIQSAFDCFGCVIDENQRYLWTRNTRALNRSLTLSPESVNTEEESLRASIDMIFSYKDVQSSKTAQELSSGKSAAEILGAHLEDAQILNLYGCTLSQVLYYVSQDAPVLAVMGNEAGVLITAYDSANVTIYNPYLDQTQVLSMGDADAYFSAAGYPFISYVNLEK